jgi:hypothetical protein
VLFGYALVFGEDIGGGLPGGLGRAGLRDAAALVGPPSDPIPMLAFAMFQLMFAVITGALLAGAIADRWPRDPMRPHNMPTVLVGAGLLWFGWFGFTAGSALAAGAVAANAFTTTTTASAAGLISWLVYQQQVDGRPTSLGAASGAVAARHGVGGLPGTALIGLFATVAVNPAGADALHYGGGLGQLRRQPVDEAEHAESGYDLSISRSTGRGYVEDVSSEGLPRSGGTRDRRTWSGEAGHGDRQAVRAGGRQERPSTPRGARDDGQRGAGLRPAEGAHRGLPGCRVHRGLRAQAAARGRG